MDTSSRRQRIEAMLVEEPNDAFLRYSLAIELDKEGDHDRSLAALRALMDAEPAYVPAFLMSARQLVRLGRVDEAQDCLRNGIEQARQQDDSHVADEMNQLLESLSAAGS